MLHFVEAGIEENVGTRFWALDELALSSSYLIGKRTPRPERITNASFRRGNFIVKVLHRKPAVLHDVMIKTTDNMPAPVNFENSLEMKVVSGSQVTVCGIKETGKTSKIVERLTVAAA